MNKIKIFIIFLLACIFYACSVYVDNRFTKISSLSEHDFSKQSKYEYSAEVVLEKYTRYNATVLLHSKNEFEKKVTADFVSGKLDSPNYECDFYIDSIKDSTHKCSFNYTDKTLAGYFRIISDDINQISISKFELKSIKLKYLFISIALKFLSLFGYAFLAYRFTIPFRKSIANKKIFDSDLAIISIILIVFVLVNLFLGQDDNWDLRNYHYYVANALIHGRTTLDIAPAGIQSYINPFAYLPFYIVSKQFTPIIASSIVALLSSFAIIALYFLVKQFSKNRFFALAICMASLMYPTVYSHIGSSYSDLMLSVFIISALLVIVIAIHSNEYKVRYFIFTGALLGIAVGLKLTYFIFPASIIVSLVICSLIYRKNFINAKCIFPISFGCALGFFISDGYWMLNLYKAFGSPFFPFFNKFIGSVFYPAINFSDSREVPVDLFSALIYPFLHRDLNGFGYTIFPVAIFFVVAIFYMKSIVNLIRRSPAKFFIIVFFAVSYINWLMFFSIERYFVAGFLIAPLCIYFLIEEKPFVIKSCFSLLYFFVLILSIYIYQDYSRRPFSNSLFSVHVPVLPNDQCKILIFSRGDPLSYIIPFLPQNFGYLRIANTEWPWSDYLIQDRSIFHSTTLSQLKSAQCLYLLTTQDLISEAPEAILNYGLHISKAIPIKLDMRGLLIKLEKKELL